MSGPARRRFLSPQGVVAALLGAWALGLVVATVQLAGWQRALTEVLVQMRADGLVRASAAGSDAVHPEWHRRRALALLDAVEHLHDDQWWTLVMPGSWRVFDDVEERATERVATAFSHVVVVTLRRELEGRSARLAGTSTQGAQEAQGACQAPWVPAAAPGAATLVIAQMPEYAAMQRLVDEARGLDRAVAALRELHQGGPQAAGQLRELVRYSLGAELSRPASRSLALFRAAPDPQDPAFEGLTMRMQWRLRCTAILGMGALQARLVEHNPLLKTEDELAGMLRPALFAAGDASALPGTGRLRQAVQRVADAQALVAQADGEWMAPGSDGFGDGHARLLAAMAQIPLLGPQLAGQMGTQAAADHARLLAQVGAQLGRRGATVRWEERSGRFEVSPRPLAIRAALVALLEAPFMAGDTAAATSEQDLVALVDQRLAFEREVLPGFPAGLRAPAQAYVEARIEAMALAAARRWMLDATAGSDEALARLERLVAALDAAGAPALATWLGQRLSGEVLSCLSLAMPGCAAHSPAQLQVQPAPDPRVPWGSEGAGEAPASSVD